MTEAKEKRWPVTEVFGPCVIWQKALTSEGYGVTWRDGWALAHRVAYEDAKGLIPLGLQLDHLCRNRACVNPDHLEAVTAQVNTLRSPIAPAAINARKTSCVHGHTLTDAYIRPDGRRRCRTCEQDRSREYQRAKARG